MSKKNGEYKISVAQLRRMREARMGTVVIGRELGVNTATVRNWLLQFGLPTKLPPLEFSDDLIDNAIKRHKGKVV